MYKLILQKSYRNIFFLFGLRKWFIAKHFDRDKMGQERVQSEWERDWEQNLDWERESISCSYNVRQSKAPQNFQWCFKKIRRKVFTNWIFFTKMKSMYAMWVRKETKHLQKGVIGHFYFIRSFVMLWQLSSEEMETGNEQESKDESETQSVHTTQYALSWFLRLSLLNGILCHRMYACES